MIKSKIISLFSLAGGFDIGIIDSDFEVVLAIEPDLSYCQTLRQSYPDLKILQGGIENFSSEEILKASKLRPLEADLLIVGSPYKPFSFDGIQEELNKTKDKFIHEVIRVVRGILPTGFVMQNYKGSKNGYKGFSKKFIASELQKPVQFKNQEYIYTVENKIKKAEYFGVPQITERVYFVGKRIGYELYSSL